MASFAMAAAAAAALAYDARTQPKPATVAVPLPTATPYRPAGPDISLPAMYDAPLRVTLGPRTASVATLRLGPSENYIVVGTLQAGSGLEVIGRDETAEWLAVVFPPNSTFVAWLRATSTVEVEDIEDLPVEPVRFLP